MKLLELLQESTLFRICAMVVAIGSYSLTHHEGIVSEMRKEAFKQVPGTVDDAIKTGKLLLDKLNSQQ